MLGNGMGVGGAVMAGIGLLPIGRVGTLFRGTYRARAAAAFGEEAIKGKDIHHIIPQSVYRKFKDYFKSIGFDVHSTGNLIPLEPSFHKPHPKYNRYAMSMIESIIENGQGISDVYQFRAALRDVILEGQSNGISKLDDLF